MRKSLRLAFLIVALLALVPAAAKAEPSKSDNDGLAGAIQKTLDKVVGVFTGDNGDTGADETGGAKGQQNALEQIDKNIGKHGGSHHGLENARRNIVKKQDINDIDGDGDTDELIDVIVEEITEGAKEEISDSLGEPASSEKPNRKTPPGHANKNRD